MRNPGATSDNAIAAVDNGTRMTDVSGLTSAREKSSLATEKKPLAHERE
jgi:hypothetical protein